MKDFKGSQTEKNMLVAFQGESQARNRYTFFEEQARRENNEEVAQLFHKMAQNELMHAKIWFKLLHGGFGESGANIQEAANGENQEWRSMYPSFAQKAREEGFEEIAKLFEQVADIERDHERIFLKAFIALQEKRLEEPSAEVTEAVKSAKVEEKPVYRCMFCGASFSQRPDVCPVCGAIGSFEAGLS